MLRIISERTLEIDIELCVCFTDRQKIQSYLSNRYKRVMIKTLYGLNCNSDWKIVKHGVPQGSILGPLLFLFYINYLPQLVRGIASSILFPDDTNFIVSNFNQRTMNKDIDLVLEIAQKWFESNVMFLNFNKTSFMQFSSNIYDQPPDNIQVDNHRISLRNSVKFLGITIESS